MMPQTFSSRVIDYLFTKLPSELKRKDGVSVMNPFSDMETQRVCSVFFKKYYNDNNTRTAIIGINPGRFGGGITGIPFTDPVALEEFCNIPNTFKKQRELSSRFVYEMIEKLGGTTFFFRRFYFATMYPLALIKGEKNYNYYDSPLLLKSLKKEITQNLKSQISFGLNRKRAICLGKKNFIYLNEINSEEKLFEELIWVEHPRYIQQYKLKSLSEYIQKYKEVLGL